MENEVRLDSLPVGASFELVLMTTNRRVSGKVLRVTPCSVTVKLDTGVTTREFARINPKTGEEEMVRIPIPSTIEHWAGDCPVVPVVTGTVTGRLKESVPNLQDIRTANEKIAGGW